MIKLNYELERYLLTKQKYVCKIKSYYVNKIYM
jgi:hypothetical protein